MSNRAICWTPDHWLTSHSFWITTSLYQICILRSWLKLSSILLWTSSHSCPGLVWQRHHVSQQQRWTQQQRRTDLGLNRQPTYCGTNSYRHHPAIVDLFQNFSLSPSDITILTALQWQVFSLHRELNVPHFIGDQTMDLVSQKSSLGLFDPVGTEAPYSGSSRRLLVCGGGRDWPSHLCVGFCDSSAEPSPVRVAWQYPVWAGSPRWCGQVERTTQHFRKLNDR